MEKIDSSIVEEEHRIYHRRIAYIIAVILVLLATGTLFYHYVEGWRYLDAIYFSSYTITTVGYGEFVPKTDAGKIFTIFYMFTGVAIALYGLSLLATHFIESREEFWLKRLGRIRLRQRTGTFWEKIKSLTNYQAEKLVQENKKTRKK